MKKVKIMNEWISDQARMDIDGRYQRKSCFVFGIEY